MSDRDNGQLVSLNVDVKVDLRRALLGGALAAFATLAGAYLVGLASGYEAMVLLEAALPVTRSLASTVILASATILALMLTLLSLSNSASSDLQSGHYKRVRQIAFIDMITLVAAVLVLLLLNVPLPQSDNLPPHWFTYAYYLALGCSSLLGGMLISVVLMLYHTVSNVIDVVGLASDTAQGGEGRKHRVQEQSRQRGPAQ